MLEENLLSEVITDPAIVGNLIPQKAPFVMVDKMFFFTATTVTSGLTVSEDNLFTKASFFTEPGIVEHLAQTVALHTGYQYFIRKEAAPVGYLGSIKKVEIQRLPKTGEELKTTASILHEIMGVTMVSIICKIGEELIATAVMKTVIAEESKN